MKHLIALHCLAAVVLAGLGLIAPAPVRAANILQTPGANFVAFEAEENVTIIAGTPTSWVITNDVTPSGSTALFASGANGTAFPTSLASYSIKFSFAGDYKVYFRWRANEAYTDIDPNAANSYYTPRVFDTTSTNVADYAISSVNNTRVKPESNTYHVDGETTVRITVSQAQVDAGVPLVFTVGTREAGMMFDRIVLSTDTALTEAQFNTALNSDTDVFVQPSGVNYVAFEAESLKVKITPGTPTSFVITNDVTAGGSTALFASGANGTAFPTSLASYSIKFSFAGDYKVYFRWRANEAYTDIDPNAANSYYTPRVFDTTSTNVADYAISSVNNTRVKPESNTYHVDGETTVRITVSQAQVDAGVPLVFTVGTREAGMMFDRFLLSTDTALTEADFNALENTGAGAPPVLTGIVASGTLSYVKVTFSKPMSEFLDPSSFVISGGVDVLDAVLDLNTLKDIILTTSPQTPDTLYTLTVNYVYDRSGNPVALDTTTNFYSWRLVAGFAKRELYFALPGTDVNSLINAPKYPNSPEQVDVVRGLASVNLPRARNYGVRLTGYFTPNATGIYEFFMYNNDEAQLAVSVDESPANLQTILTAPSTTTMAFSAGTMGTMPDVLTAGQRYYIQVLLKQGDDFDAFVNVAARLQGDPTPAENLQPLKAQVSTFVNPLLATVNIVSQPVSVTITSGNRARFEASATSPNGPVFYQWQRNGTDISGATRAAYYTPVLNTSDSGQQYRALIYGGGSVATSSVAIVTVNAGPAPVAQPFIGVNFIGGGFDGPGGTLLSNDVVGVVPQANYNNLAGGPGNVSLQDADGAPSPVSATFSGLTWFTGTGESTAENILFQGYLHDTNNGVHVTLNNVPPGNYNLIAYAVGFNYNAIYDQSFELVGAGTYPIYHIRAQHAGEYNAAPSVFRRMSSTNPSARDSGNYIMFENVSPDPSGVLTLNVLNESNVGGIGYVPVLNGFQLVQAVFSVSTALSVSRNGPNVTIAWDAAATGFVLESSPSLGSTADWQPVLGVPNPITGAGSTTETPSGLAQFYRLRQ